jgi:hypothetical protein
MQGLQSSPGNQQAYPVAHRDQHTALQQIIFFKNTKPLPLRVKNLPTQSRHTIVDMTASKTIAFLYPGMMGASLARALHKRKPHYTLLTSLSGRSQASLERAESAGLENVPLSDLVARSDIIVSILPPSAAVDLAKDIATILPSVKRSQPPVYVEANAVAPDTVGEISTILSAHGCPVIDGCVIGGPARDGYDPKIYLSSKPEWETTMLDVASILGSDDSHSGLKITVLQGAGEGGASALKMCYAGIAKGKTALATLFVLGGFYTCPMCLLLYDLQYILVAQAHSPATADALLGELASSQLDCLVRYAGDVADAVPKAYRVSDRLKKRHRRVEH